MTRKLQPLLGALALTIAAAAALGPAGAAGAKRDYVAHRDLDYDLGSPPPSAQPDANRLDLYHARGARKRSRPVVVWIHGGGWRKGDKHIGARKKARLFTGARYVFASLNYRLSSAPFDPARPDPSRVMFPAHPHDVGEALGWLKRNVGRYGGDRRRLILIGHSAGAHLASLVATDPGYLRAHGVGRRRVLGFVSLDGPAFDIAIAADPATSHRSRAGREMLWNAFGTPQENALSGAWAEGSPLTFAGPEDPPGLLVTQAGNELRLSAHREMALALGRDPQRAVLPLPLDHREINHALGSADEDHGETGAVMKFVRRLVARARETR
jgi:arylformamidase